MIRKLIHQTCQLGLGTLFTLIMVITPHAETVETLIPADSFFYLKLQNLAACREAIEASDSWKEATSIITDSSKWVPVSHFMQTLPTFLGTDIQGALGTFVGDQIALTVFPGAEGLSIGVVVQNAGKTQDAEQIFSKLIGTLAGTGNEVNRSEDAYRNIHYSTVQLNQHQLSYGSVSDFFLIGSSPDSFKKMVDVYKTKKASIANNTTYLSVSETYRQSEIFAFVDAIRAAPYLTSILPYLVAREVETFATFGCSWEMLQAGGGLRLFGHLKDGAKASVISRLKTETRMQTMRKLSGKEEFFLALAPSSAPMFWRVFLGGPDTDTHRFLFPPAIDLQAAIAGELTLSVDFSSIVATRSHYNRYIVNRPDGTKIESVNIDFPEVNVGLLLRPDAPEKLQAVFKQFLEKTAIPERRQQVDYKGVTMNVDSIPGTLYYGNRGDFFLLTFSEKQFQTMVDNLLDETRTRNLQERLERIEAPPVGVLQFTFWPIANAAVITSPWMTSEAAAPTRRIGAHLASLIVGEETTRLDIAHPSNEKGIDTVAKLAPFLFLLITEQIPFGQ